MVFANGSSPAAAQNENSKIERQRDVLARMLSGAVLNDIAVLEYVGEWVGVHDARLKLIQQGAKTNEEQIRALLRRADDILERAHRDLCG